MRDGSGVEKTLGVGVVGTATVAGLHQISRRLLKDAPRIDELGERVIVQTFRRIGREPPKHSRALSWIFGNLGTDTLLYMLVAAGKPAKPIVRGLWVGLAAGVSTLVLPWFAGVTEREVALNKKMVLNTLGIYLVAGLAAGAAQHVAARLAERS